MVTTVFTIILTFIVLIMLINVMIIQNDMKELGLRFTREFGMMDSTNKYYSKKQLLTLLEILKSVDWDKDKWQSKIDELNKMKF